MLGRKTKLTDNIIDSIYVCIKQRMKKKQITETIGVDPKTFRNWIARGVKANDGLFRKLVDTIQRAESELREESFLEHSDLKSQRIFLYFIQGEMTRLIKIGQTRNHPHQKLYEFQSASPDKLRLLKVAHAEKGYEKQLHLQFGPNRAHGTWFYPSQELLEFIESLKELSDFVDPDNQ